MNASSDARRRSSSFTSITQPGVAPMVQRRAWRRSRQPATSKGADGGGATTITRLPIARSRRTVSAMSASRASRIGASPRTRISPTPPRVRCNS